MGGIALCAMIAATILGQSCKGCHALEAQLSGGPITDRGAVEAFLLARKDGHTGSAFWGRYPFRPTAGITGDQLIAPTAWEEVEDERGDDWSYFRYRITSTTADGAPVQRLWDYCLYDRQIFGVWYASEGTKTECARMAAEVNSYRLLIPAERQLVSYLLARRSGSKGKEFWSPRPAPTWPRDVSSELVAPTHWERVQEKHDLGWSWFLYRIMDAETVEPRSEGLGARPSGGMTDARAIKILKDALADPAMADRHAEIRAKLASLPPHSAPGRLWDFCLVGPAKSPLLAGVWDANEENPEECSHQ